jgi:hypothetical protein
MYGSLALSMCMISELAIRRSAVMDLALTDRVVIVTGEARGSALRRGASFCPKEHASLPAHATVSALRPRSPCSRRNWTLC